MIFSVDQYVLRIDITVVKTFLVNILYSIDDLLVAFYERNIVRTEPFRFQFGISFVEILVDKIEVSVIFFDLKVADVLV